MEMRHSRHLHVWPMLVVAGAVGFVLLPAKPFVVDHGSQATPTPVGVAVASAPAERPQNSDGPAAKVLSVATTTPAAFNGAEVVPSASGALVIGSVAAPVGAGPSLATPTPSSAATAKPTVDGRVAGTAVNARSGPEASAGVQFVLAAGEAVKVGESTGGWTHVFRQNGQDGWVYHRYLAGPETVVADAAPATPTRTQKPRPPSPNFVRFQSPAPVLAAPADEAPLLFVLQPGARVQIAETRGIWIRVVTTDGISGWTQS